MRVVMLAIIDQAHRKFNADQTDGVNRRHRTDWRSSLVIVQP
jgi:hypothetical protein